VQPSVVFRKSRLSAVISPLASASAGEPEKEVEVP
jgi:hypothetical protein